MRAVLRWLKRITITLLIVGLLAVGVVLIFIHTDYGRDFIRRKAEAALLNSFPGGAHIGHLSGSIFGTLEIDDLRLNGRDGKPMIIVGTTRAKLKLSALFGKTVRVDSLHLEDVTFDQHPQPEAPPEIPETPKEGGGGNWSVEVVAASVLRGRVVIANEQRTIVDLSDLEADASLSVADGVTVAVHALGQSVGKSVEATALLNITDGVIAFPYLMAKVDEANVFALAVYTGPRVDGVLRAVLPRRTAKEIAGVTLPGDLQLVVTALEGNVDAKLAMNGAVVRALLDTDLVAKSAKGIVIADVPDAAAFDPRYAGGGVVTASINASVEHVRGIVTLDGIYKLAKTTVGKDQIRDRSLLAVDASLAGAWMFFESAADVGGARATAIAEVEKQKDNSYKLTKSTFIASARRIGATRTDLAIGSITTSLRGSGEVWPKPAIKLTGTAGGDGLRFGDLSAQTVDVIATVNKHTGTVHLDLGTARKAGKLLGSATIDAHGSLDLPDAGPVITIDVDSHSISTPTQGVWAGNGGRITVDPTKIAVTGFKTGSGGSKVIADATFIKASKDLSAKVDATDVVLATLVPDIKGTVAAHATVIRHNNRWNGAVAVSAKQLAIPKQPVMDLDANVKVNGRKVTADVVSSMEAGSVTLTADLEGPYNMTDPLAWKRLDRKAIDEVGISVATLDLAKLGKAKLVGTLNGRLGISSDGANGELDVKGVMTDAGTIAGNLALVPDEAGRIRLNVSTSLDDKPVVVGDAKLTIPARPFDPASWKTLGKNVLNSADIEIQAIDITPAFLAKLKVDAPYQATLRGKVHLDEGADTIKITTVLSDLRDGFLKQPVRARLEATIDDKGVSGDVTLEARNAKLIEIQATSPITTGSLDHLKELPVTGTISIPNTDAATFVGVIGRGDVVGGKVDGAIELGGTIGKPTASGAISLTDVKIAPGITGRTSTVLHDFTTAISYDGQVADVTIKGHEDQRSSFTATVHADTKALDEAIVTLTAKHFDIAPATAFAPGAASAAKGIIDADLRLSGLDPNKSELGGTLKLTNGRFPLSPLLGTLRNIDALVKVENHAITIDHVKGKLGKGDVSMGGQVAFAGLMPKTVNLTLQLAQVSLVRAFQPTIDSKIKVTLENPSTTTLQLNGDIDVSQTKVSITTNEGTKLLPTGTPDDMVFVDEGNIGGFKLAEREPPTKPWLLATVAIHPVQLEIIQEQFQVRASASGQLTLSLGQGSVGLDGSIEASRADLDLLGSRSQLERGEIVFDGTVDPLLNVRMTRDLGNMTVTANVSGRASKPEIAMTSDTGEYTQGELYAYFLGGQTGATNAGGDVQQAGAAAGSNYALGVFSKRLNQFASAHLPIKLSFNFNYVAATASSTQAFQVGTWLSAKLFIAARTHPEARVDENTAEGILEYHLRGSTVIEGQWGNAGYDSADIVRRWNW